MNFPRAHFSNSTRLFSSFLGQKLRLNRGVLNVDYF